VSGSNDPSNQSFPGLASASALANEYAVLDFIVRAIISGYDTISLVEVMACSNSGAIAAEGSVDVRPCVNQVDGDGKAIPHETIYGLPYVRLRAGVNAIIMDPVAGDIGIALFCSRDISSVKANKGQANPGSERIFDMADGIYIGGLLSKLPPTNLIQISGGQITVQSPGTVTINAPTVKTTGNLEVEGNLKVDGTTEMVGAVTADAAIHAKANLTVDGSTSLGGGAKAVKLSDGSNATTVNAT
jgi:hypothetical protein